MTTRISSASTLLAIAACTAVAALPAAAGPLEGGEYEWSDQYTFDDCGPEVRVDASGYGRYLLRDANPSTGGQFFRVTDKYWFQERWTNVATGAWVVRTANGLFTELPPSAISDDGTVFTFRTIEAGVPFVLYDSEGNVLMRDSGTIRLEYTFDSLGDGQPGGEMLGDPEVVRISGPHPGWYADCDDLVEWLG